MNMKRKNNNTMKTNEIEITRIWTEDCREFEIEFMLNGKLFDATAKISETEAYGDVMDEPGIYMSKLFKVFKIDDLRYFNYHNEPMTLPKDQSDAVRLEIAQEIENATNLTFIEYL